MKLNSCKVVIFFSFFLNFCFEFSSGGFPLVFPFLTTNWYYKPGPTESIILGLLVVKVLALRLGGTLAGVPYHLNDIFSRRTLNLYNGSGRGKRNLITKAPQPLSEKELVALERILLALRRIDSHDCFLRYICETSEKNRKRHQMTTVDSAWLSIFNLSPSEKQSKKSSVWDIFTEAVTHKNCLKKYSACPLEEKDFEIDSLLTGLF